MSYFTMSIFGIDESITEQYFLFKLILERAQIKKIGHVFLHTLVRENYIYKLKN